jgi:hypothetical protein
VTVFIEENIKNINGYKVQGLKSAEGIGKSTDLVRKEENMQLP